ncbi:hypothetical protein SNOG_14081 [Parastagonospora nodorum SN15]|uniref:DH domain-containing protein n=1 Tax=Phaeosphaeria nodorum (strain SN15 / ATCC MYA-4574 / FGSC 10173) TaxID=321614 RepID=Q0U2F2_PHANO|nr:hypothetical protein SNOG_14081 [Parastagonospora nodorum SN15]EAT78706.2 hypothetical protein SNOG_14081 [Parastagonospora nodorum SN15]
MVVIHPEPAALSAEDLELFYTTDELLSNAPVLIFYGPTATSTQATHSRIQAHVFTPAGLQNFARLIISPTATFYGAVTCLPREEQGDEICRGLAFSLYKYFLELPTDIKNAWEKRHGTLGHLPSAPELFSESHAAILAAKMVKVDNVADVIVDVRHALGEQTLSWVDLDVVLPPGSIHKQEARESAQFDEAEDDLLEQRYGQYAPVVKLFGETAFLPTSKLRRAPSKPTALNRTQSFSRNQKETLRREMCELLDTEENYVSKVYDLVHNVAVEFRDKAKLKSHSSTSPTEQALQGLFPPSLDRILEVNTKFLDTLRVILEETENGAIEDIEQATDDVFIAPLRGQKDPIDVTGAAAVAKALVEWFPQFGDCYTDYMAAHGDFSQLLKAFTKDTASSFSKRVYETGEQRLTSMLIEPVQRLPRYNLYIDNIIKQLPVRHPAIKTFLKARDIIADICSREGPSAQQIRVFDRLRKMILSWPAAFNPRGRLITAIDYVELSPPYHGELSGPHATPGIFVLFTDFLVLLHKPSGCTTSARSLLADLDNPKFAEAFHASTELIFHQYLDLASVFLSEHSEGSMVQLLSPVPVSQHTQRPRSRDRQQLGIRMFYLQGLYEGKGQKVVEEFTKARVEGRFSEVERESPKWEVRTLPGDISLFSSISEQPRDLEVEGRKEPAKIQILVDAQQTSTPLRVGVNGIEIIVTLSVLGDGFFLLDTNGVNGYTAKDKLTSLEFLPVLTKRLANFFHIRNSIKNPPLRDGDTSRPASSNKNASFNAGAPTDSLVRLEESLANLTLALHARKGNIVGRSVRARAVADELMVNELYNSILENPSNLDLAAQSSVDVLFAVFEKFLNIAWKERMGPVLSHATLVSLQMRSDSMYPGEFEDFFRTTVNEFSPQNQRALRAVIQLLAELLDGTSNDGDRGILTAAFAEMIVPAGNANDFISLMDRLVQDIEALFAIQPPGLNTPNYGSIDSKGRSIAGSINSNTSLRKRFGFGTLTRENSKSESESKVGSLWRSLNAGRISPKRPSSRDRPTVLGAFNFENGAPAGNGRSFVGALGTIGEVPLTSGPPRKKRRSSLSDLKTLQDADDVPTWSPQTPRRPDSVSRDTRQSKNSPGNVLDRAGTAQPKSIIAKPDAKDEVTVKAYNPIKKRSERGQSVSGIPSLKSSVSNTGLSERPGSGNTVKLPPSSRSSTKTGGPSASPPKRLRMQSPQKLRERLQNQQRDIDSASQDLQNELSAIGHELNARSIPRLTTQSSAPLLNSSPTKPTSLESRIALIEKQLKTTLEGLSTRTSSIAQDVSSSLQVSESRAKHLDQLYRDMNAENEALYARFNEELEKATSSARKGKADEEVQRRLKASEEEAARLRKENARLKREVAGLKAQIRE